MNQDEAIRSQSRRALRASKFRFFSALNAYVWTRNDLERDALAGEVRAARERWLEAAAADRWLSLPPLGTLHL